MGTAVGSKEKKDGPPQGKRRRRTRAENTAWLLRQRRRQAADREQRRRQAESRKQQQNSPAPPQRISTMNAAPNPQIAREERWRKERDQEAQLAQLDEKHATLRKALSSARLHRPYLNKLTAAERAELDSLLDQRAPSSFSASITPWINRAQRLMNRMTTS